MSSTKVGAEEARIQQEIVDAAVVHHAIFSKAMELNQTNKTRLDVAESSTTKLTAALSRLSQCSQKLVQAGQAWRQEKQVVSSAVSQCQKFVELLEAPQTLEVCLRSDMYHEGLLVMDHVTNLLAERGGGAAGQVPLLQRLDDEILAALRRTLAAVIPRLALAIPLASAVKLTTFLRRIGTPEVTLLEDIFLAKRGEFLDSLLQEAEAQTHSTYSYCSKILTVFKVQYTESVAYCVACFPNAATDPDLSTILSSWFCQRCAAFVALFESKLLFLNNGAELASLMEQIHGCASGARKLGIDVTPVLLEAVVRRIRDTFAQRLHEASLSFQAAISSYSWKLPSRTLSNVSTTSNPTAGSSSSSQDHDATNAVDAIAPPIVLLSFLPLSYAMNGLLTALNELRKCAVKSIAADCCSDIRQYVGFMIHEAQRTLQSSGHMDASEQQAVKLYCECLAVQFVPHVVRCVGRLFPSHVLLVQSLAEDLEADLRGGEIPLMTDEVREIRLHHTF